MGINLREKPVNEMSMCELAYNDCYVKMVKQCIGIIALICLRENL